MRDRANPRGRFRLDQRLKHRLERTADKIIDASAFQSLQQFEQGGLAQACQAIGQHRQARQHWQHAHDICTDLGVPEASRMHQTQFRRAPN